MAGSITVTAATGKKVRTKALGLDDFKGYVIFSRGKSMRGTSTYKGQFGFDWMRDSYKVSRLTPLWKEYTPIYRYNIEETGHIQGEKNTDDELLNPPQLFNSPAYTKHKKSKKDITNREAYYYTPWFIAYKDDVHTVYVDMVVTSEGEGYVEFKCPDSNVEVSWNGSPTGIIETSKLGVHRGVRGEIEIKFTASISEHTVIEARYFDHAGKKCDGDVIGVMNVYKNNIEYDLDVKYVKVLFAGPLTVDGKEYYLDPVAKAYTHYTNIDTQLKSELNALNSQLGTLNSGLLIAESLAAQESYIKEVTDNILKKNLEILENANNEIKAREIDNYQNDMMTDYEKLVNDTDSEKYIENCFNQALIHYKKSGIETFVVEEKDFISEYNPIESMEWKSSWSSRSFSSGTTGFTSGGLTVYNLEYKYNIDSASELLNEITAKYYTTNPEHVGAVVFCLPTNFAGTAGLAEGLSCAADDVFTTPYVIGASSKAYPNIAGRVSSIVHEIAHSLTLHHSFEHLQKHRFTKGSTENIMDYSTYRRTFWKWQIDRMHRDSKDLVQKTV